MKIVMANEINIEIPVTARVSHTAPYFRNNRRNVLGFPKG